MIVNRLFKWKNLLIGSLVLQHHPQNAGYRAAKPQIQRNFECWLQFIVQLCQ